MTNSRFKENIFLLLIFIVILEYQLIIVHNLLLDRVLKLFPLIFLLIFFPNVKDNLKNIYINKAVKIYGVLFFLMFISCVFNFSVATFIGLFKFFLIFLIFYILIYKVNPFYFSDKILKFPVLLGALFSIHSIVLWLLLYCGVDIDYTIMTNERAGNYNQPFNFFWGNMIWTRYVGGLSRAASFFLKPSRYGCFLLFPAFVSIGYFFLTKKRIYLIAASLCFVTMLLTFSGATLFSTIGVILISILISKTSRIKQIKKSVVITSLCILVGVLVMVQVHKFYKTKFSSAMGKKTELAFITRSGVYKTLFHFLVHDDFVNFNINKLFGYGFGEYQDSSILSQYAIERWLLIGGFPIIIIWFIYFYYMFKVHVFPALGYQSSGIIRYVAMAYMAQTFMHFQDGDWWQSYYFYTTAVLILLKTYTFREKIQKKFYSINTKLNLSY